MAATANRSLHIILIDDDDVAVEAVVRLLHHHHLPYLLTVFSDARVAQLALVSPLGPDLLAEPHLILLALNMPRMHGFEFLDWLRSVPDLVPLSPITPNRTNFTATASTGRSTKPRLPPAHRGGHRPCHRQDNT